MTNDINSTAQQNIKEKLRDKPEADYSFEDWRALCIEASHREASGEMRDCLVGLIRTASDSWQIASLKTIQAWLLISDWYNSDLNQNQDEFLAASSTRYDQAIALCDEIIDLCRASDDPHLMERCANALRGKGRTLILRGKKKDALIVIDDMISKYGDCTDNKIIARVLAALNDKADIVKNSQNSESEIMIYDDIISRYGAHDDLDIMSEVAKSMAKKGCALDRESRRVTALAVFDALVAKYTPYVNDNIEIAGHVALSLSRKARIWYFEKNYPMVIELSDEIIDRYGNYKSTFINRQVINSFLNKADALLALGLPNEAIATFNAAVSRCDDHKKASVIARAINTLYARLNLNDLSKNISPDNAIAAVDEMMLRYGEREEAEVATALAKVLFKKAFIEREIGALEQAMSTFNTIITRYDARKELIIIDTVAKAHGRYVECLRDLGMDMMPGLVRCGAYVNGLPPDGKDEILKWDYKSVMKPFASVIQQALIPDE